MTKRREPLFPNVGTIARREYSERVHSRLFAVSTLLLASLAVFVALTPIVLKFFERGSETRIAVVAADDDLAQRSITYLGQFLDTADPSGTVYRFERGESLDNALERVDSGALHGAISVERLPTSQLDFTFYGGESMGADRTQILGIGTLAVSFVDWIERNPRGGDYVPPSLDVLAVGGPTAGAQPVAGAEYASRRIVGIVFVILIFITLVIYGMWVAAGVVAEKSSRVMELLISAASARQLVLGKVIGLGLAGATQYVAILVPALLTLLVEDRIAIALLGPSASIAPSLAALSPTLLLAFAAFYVLGFALYALIYAAAGSLVSRPEDLQVIALPLSLVAIVGYLQAVMALTGGTAGFLRTASLIPFWSPFIMLTRLSIGRVEPWELVVAFGALIVTIVLVAVIAIRIYAAGVLLYGQRPGFRAYLSAARRG